MRILVLAALLVAGCASNITSPGAEYGFHFLAVANDETGEYSYVYVSEVACSGPATNKLGRRDVIVGVTINGESFNLARNIPRKRVENMSSQLALARHEIEIWTREGGILGPERYHRISPGQAHWNPATCGLFG